MVKLRSSRFCGCGGGRNTVKEEMDEKHLEENRGKGIDDDDDTDIKWEVRPGGLIVQKRSDHTAPIHHQGIISITVSTLSSLHHISLPSTSTFGELKMKMSMETGIEPREQRVLYRGKEREDGEYLHMLGVRDNDKLFLIEDPSCSEH